MSFPDLPASMRCSVYEEDVYRVRTVFGAAAVASYRSKDATITRVSAGQFQFALPQTYEELTHFSSQYLACAAGAVLFPVVLSHTLSTDGKILVEVRTEAGVATDPASGDSIGFSFGVSSNTLNTKFTG